MSDGYQKQHSEVRTKSSWTKGTEYIIKKVEEPVIRRKHANGISLRRYDPFEFYGEDQSIHRQFAALKLSGNVTVAKSHERILGFVNKWGLLSKSRSESVRDFRIEQRLFHSASVMPAMLLAQQVHDLIDALNEFSQLHWLMLRPEIEDLDEGEAASHAYLVLQPGKAPSDWHYFYDNDHVYGDDWVNDWYHTCPQWEEGKIPQDANPKVIYWLAGCILESLTNRGLHGHREVTNYHSKPFVTVMEFPSLLAAIYVMFQLDSKGSADWKICQHKRCGKYYLDKNRPLYCSEKCAKAAAQASWHAKNNPNRQQGKGKTNG